MDNIVCYQEDNHIWYACGVLEIPVYPDRLKRTAVSDFCAMARYDDTAAELVCFSDEGGTGAVRTYVLVRRYGSMPEKVKTETQTECGIIKAQMEGAGFETVMLRPDQARELAGKMYARKNVTLAFPGEDLSGEGVQWYVPGRYDRLQSVNLSDVFRILSQNPGTGMSLQISRTSLFREEQELAERYIRWAEDQAGSDDTGSQKKLEETIDCYRAKAALKDAMPCFLVQLLWGSDDAMRDLTAVCRRSGFSFYPVPPEVLSRNYYLSDAFVQMTALAANEAHMPGAWGRCPQTAGRLSHLSSARNADRLLFGRCENGMPGVRVNPFPAEQMPLPEKMTDSDGLPLGKRRGNGDTDIYYPLNNIAKHVAAAGMPGSGKTVFLFHFLHGLYTKKIPFLAFEPAKTEYRELIAAIPELKIYTPGRTDVAPMPLNPFIPPKGITLEQFMPSVETAFQTAFSMTTPLDVIFPEVLRSCYAKHGWSSGSTRDSEGVRFFGMREFIEAFREEITRSEYSSESKSNLMGGGVFRLQSLMNKNSSLFDTDLPAPVDDLLQGFTLIELDAIDDRQVKSLVMAFILLQLKLVIRRDQEQDGKLKNAIVIDEAHVLLGKDNIAREMNQADPRGKAAEFLTEMVLINRAYGTGMVFADQSPEKLTKDIFGNADLKIMFRLTDPDSCTFVRNAANLTSEQANALGRLRPGEAYISCSALDKAVRVQFPDAKKELNIVSGISDETVRERAGGKVSMPFRDCGCDEDCDVKVRSEAEFGAQMLYDRMRPLFADRSRLKEYLRDELGKEIDKIARGKDARLRGCLEMMIMKRLETGFSSETGFTETGSGGQEERHESV